MIALLTACLCFEILVHVLICISKKRALKLCSATLIGPLHDPVTWYKITHADEQGAQWDFKNKGRCIILEVPLCNLLTGMCDFVPRDRVLQRTHLESHNKYEKITRF